ncbi:hypothetical protein E1258_06375 [Micromonospora sp. KC207]|uniref:membrane protein YczE n=1 Tax=Micromonospora sp. KC207 TaxID=2530377 RepID=UPI00104A8160|nr:hypothetical protein [Micromonospora sp. KC207]TDC65208.1 hypothetical protein E1258_06375 [Micromonospora sp. KC207]
MAAIGNLRHRPARRLVQLYGGLVLYGVSMALMIRSGLGLDPWDVFHQGVARQTGLSFGTVTIAVGALVLLLWVPLRQRPGLGTVSNVLVIGLVVDATLALLPDGLPLAVRAALLVVGIGANGAATALYLGARLGPGPRDGLMTGYVARHPGRSVRGVRTVIEVAVLALGWLLGGTVGIGTVAYALAIGPLVQLFLPAFTVDPPPGAATEPRPVAAEPRPIRTEPNQVGAEPVGVPPAEPRPARS